MPEAKTSDPSYPDSGIVERDYDGDIACEVCGGTGRLQPGNGDDTCWGCGGDGWV